MKKDSNKKFSIVGKYMLAAFFSTVVSIQPASASEQLFNRTISRILVYNTNQVVFVYSPAGANTGSCTSRSAGTMALLDMTTTTGADIMYATALSAYMAGKKVSFGVNGCLKFGSSTIPRIYRVELR